DAPAVGRPGDAVGAVGQAGDAGALVASHPAYEQLGARTFAGGDISETGAVGRPARRRIAVRAGQQRMLLARRDVHQPDGRARLVGLDVVRLADIGDGPPVRADLASGRDLEIEQIGAGEIAAWTGSGPGERRG